MFLRKNGYTWFGLVTIDILNPLTDVLKMTMLSSVISEPSCSFILKGPCTSLTVWVIYRRYDPVYHIVRGLYCVLLSLIFVRIYFKVSKCTLFSYFQYRYSLISILGISMC